MFQVLYAQAAPQAAAYQLSDIVGQLTKLAELWANGLLDDAEFKKAKAKVLMVETAASSIDSAMIDDSGDAVQESSLKQQLQQPAPARNPNQNSDSRPDSHNGTSCHRNIGFVHIPKTGGSTVVSALRECKELEALILRSSSSRFHQTAQQQRSIYSSRWDDAYTFGIVRNPFSWTVSQFFYNLEMRCEGTQKPACNYRAAVFGNSSVYSYSEDHRWAFTGWLIEHDQMAKITQLPFMTPNLISGVGNSSTSQLAWLSDLSRDARLLVRHVVRLEDVNDYSIHATCHGLRAIACNEPVGWLHANKLMASRHAPAAAYYTQEACAIVRRRFAVDFAAFGYSTACPLPTRASRDRT